MSEQKNSKLFFNGTEYASKDAWMEAAAEYYNSSLNYESAQQILAKFNQQLMLKLNVFEGGINTQWTNEELEAELNDIIMNF